MSNQYWDTSHHLYNNSHFMALWTLSGTTRVSRYQKKHSPTHTYRGLIIPYLLPPSVVIHGIVLIHLHACQTFPQSHFQVFFGLLLGLAPSTSYSIHFFTESLSSFCSTCPYHRNLFCNSTKIMSSNHSLSLNSIL